MNATVLARRGKNVTFEIVAINLHLLEGERPESDLCAHGGLLIRNRETLLLDDSREQWALGPAMLALLRTLEEDHDRCDRGPDYLIQHCAHAFWADDNGRYFTVGCMAGRDIGVQHCEERVHVDVGEHKIEISRAEWIASVLRFAAEVRAFYDASDPKAVSPDDRAGWEAFWSELQARREKAQAELGEFPYEEPEDAT